MRNAAIAVVALLSISLFPQTASADSTEFEVSINVTWSAGDLYPPCTQLGGTGCNEIAGKFSSVFDVYANGTLVPGSMTFSVSGPDFDGLAFSFDNVPPGLAPYEIQYPPPYGSFFWSTESTETILFTGSASSTGTFSPSLIVLNCFSLQCGLFSCADVVCATGGDNPADGGAVVITQFTAAPEPSSALLLILGSISLLAFGIGRTRAAANARPIPVASGPDLSL